MRKLSFYYLLLLLIIASIDAKWAKAEGPVYNFNFNNYQKTQPQKEVIQVYKNTPNPEDGQVIATTKTTSVIPQMTESNPPVQTQAPVISPPTKLPEEKLFDLSLGYFIKEIKSTDHPANNKFVSNLQYTGPQLRFNKRFSNGFTFSGQAMQIARTKQVSQTYGGRLALGSYFEMSERFGFHAEIGASKWKLSQKIPSLYYLNQYHEKTYDLMEYHLSLIPTITLDNFILGFQTEYAHGRAKSRQDNQIVHTTSLQGSINLGVRF